MNQQQRQAELKLMKGVHVGITGCRPLKHKKSGQPFDDVDYFELLGRKAIQLDKEKPNKSLPTDYGTYDRDTINVAKEICRGIDAGIKKPELLKYLDMCIDIEH